MLKKIMNVNYLELFLFVVLKDFFLLSILYVINKDFSLSVQTIDIIELVYMYVVLIESFLLLVLDIKIKKSKSI